LVSCVLNVAALVNNASRCIKINEVKNYFAINYSAIKNKEIEKSATGWVAGRARFGRYVGRVRANFKDAQV
jgi:hypothetical protein